MLRKQVKIGSSYYHQSVGIPQGSVLSMILCSFLYGALEKVFEEYSEDIGSVSWNEMSIMTTKSWLQLFTGIVQTNRWLYVHHNKLWQSQRILRDDEQR